jgi:50S ribosomal subunit-associated GTPase HflX
LCFIHPRIQSHRPSRDASTIGTPLFDAHARSVYHTLARIGTPRHLSRSIVEVWNKVDAVQDDPGKRDELQRRLFEAHQRRARIQEQQERGDGDGGDNNKHESDDDEEEEEEAPSLPPVVPVSARTGEGLAALKAVIAGRLVADGHAVAATRLSEGDGDGDARKGE